MEDQFKELTARLQMAGFIAYCGVTGHLYVLAGTHEEDCDGIKLIQNVIMITCEPNWEIGTTWPGQIGHEFVLPNFESTLEKAMELLTFKKNNL